MKRELTCICCPIGCRLTVEMKGEGIAKISGNTCDRGRVYAENECTNPQRIVTSTVLTRKGTLASVKTDKPIPKDKLFECMKLINSIIADTPIKIGDVVAEGVFGSNIVATCDAE